MSVLTDGRAKRGGTRERGWLVWSVPGGGWQWRAWWRAERMEGEAPDEEQAIAALIHFHSPDD